MTVRSDYTSGDAALSAANVSFIVTGANVDVRAVGVTGADTLYAIFVPIVTGGVTGADITWKVIAQRIR